jgi:hypothetical protein
MVGRLITFAGDGDFLALTFAGFVQGFRRTSQQYDHSSKRVSCLGIRLRPLDRRLGFRSD